MNIFELIIWTAIYGLVLLSELISKHSGIPRWFVLPGLIAATGIVMGWVGKSRRKRAP